VAARRAGSFWRQFMKRARNLARNPSDGNAQ